MKIKAQVMIGKGPEMPRYSEYLQYVADGEPNGTKSYEEWLHQSRNLGQAPEVISTRFKTQA